MTPPMLGLSPNVVHGMTRGAAYSYPCPWLPYEERVQVAWMTILTAAQSPQYRSEESPRAYLARSAYYGVAREQQRMQSVLGGRRFIPAKNVAGVAQIANMAATDSCPEKEVGRVQWERKVNTVLRRVLASDPDGEITVRLILDGCSVRCVAADCGAPPADIYRALERTKKRLQRNLELRALASEVMKVRG